MIDNIFLKKWQEHGFRRESDPISVVVYENWTAARSMEEAVQFIRVAEAEYRGGFFSSTRTSGLDKFTSKLMTCVALLVVGSGVENKAPISYLAHLAPSVLRHQNVVEKDFDLVKPPFVSCQGIVAAIAGGYIGVPEHGRNFEEEYWQMVLLISTLVKNSFQTDLSLLHRPKTEKKKNDLFFVNGERRCVIVED